MQRTISFAVVLLLTLPALTHAQDKKPNIAKNIDYPEPTLADHQYSQHKSCTLDFWKAEGDTPRPLHIYIHGGGWTGATKK